MPSYKYRVIFEDGKVGHGKIMALNKSHAMESLKKDRIQPISIKKLPEKRQKYKRLDYNKKWRTIICQKRKIKMRLRK